MRFSRSIMALAALVGAFGAAQGANDKQSTRDLPGFNQMDKDNDGALTRAEAAGNAELLKRFSEVDSDADGKLSRVEYLKAMARADFRSLREKVADFIEPEEESATSGDTKQRR